MFFREPKQWVMITGPFINVIILVLIVYAFVKFYTPLDFPGKMNYGSEEEGEDEDSAAMDETRKILASIFPVLLLFGFSATSGVFLLQPVTERVSKMKQMLIMQGMSNTIYWLGLYLADLILLLFPFFLFSLIVLVVQIEGFYQEYGRLMVVILNFGGVLITFVYLISTCFKDVVTASKCIAPILILVGNVMPIAVAAIIIGLVNLRSDPEDVYRDENHTQNVFIFLATILYFTNPFVTFLLNAYTILIIYFSEEKNREQHEYCA